MLSVERDEIVVRDAASERRQPVTTLRAGGEFVGIEPGAPVHVYTPATPCELDPKLHLEREAISLLARAVLFWRDVPCVMAANTVY